MKQLIVLLTLVPALLKAQDTITVNKDPRLDILNAKQAAVNKLTARMTSSGQFKGYRLQVTSTRSREEAFKIKASLLQRFPDQKTYALYQSPYFKVRIGNFTDRASAEKFKNTVARYYPQGVYVVEDVIEYTPGEEPDETE